MAEEKELDKVRPTETVLKIGGRERVIRFGFSAWAKLEDKYGSLKNFGQIEKDIQEKPFHVIPELIYIGLQDKEGVTVETVLDDYSFSDIEEVTKVLHDALYGSLPQAKKKVQTVKKH